MVADAVKRANATDRVVIAWDVDPDTLNAIKAGTIDSTVVQKPWTMGYIGLKALDEIFHNPPSQLSKDYSDDPFSPYPVFVDTGTTLVDKSNMERIRPRRRKPSKQDSSAARLQLEVRRSRRARREGNASTKLRTADRMMRGLEWDSPV